MKCGTCKQSMVGKIKEILSEETKYMLHLPVWYCDTCEISTRVAKIDKFKWLKTYEWPHKLSNIFTSPFSSRPPRCIGCYRKDSMYADIGVTFGGSVFPFYTDQAPSWTCTACGYTTYVLEKDKCIWIDEFDKWVQ